MFEYLPETEEEKARIKVSYYRMQLMPNTTEVELTPESIAQDLMRRDFHGKLLNQLLTFFRQGQNYFREGRYMSAFLNFYLFLEGTYSEKGRWRNAEVREDFLTSPEFPPFVQEIIDEYLKPGGRRTWWINKMLGELKDAKGHPTPKLLNPEGIAWLLVIRGATFSTSGSTATR